jgi:hypothetical protein
VVADACRRDEPRGVLAPRQRGQKGRDQRLRRPNLAELLLQRSMEPALAQNTAAVMAGVDVALATLVGRVWEEV